MQYFRTTGYPATRPAKLFSTPCSRKTGHFAMCPRSSPILRSNLLYKMGNNFLDRQHFKRYFKLSHKHTMCPRRSCPFYVLIYFTKWVTTSWTDSILSVTLCLVIKILYVQMVVTHFTLVTYFTKWVTTFWSDSILSVTLSFFIHIQYVQEVVTHFT